MSQLTSHVLDTAKGAPAAGIAVSLFSLNNSSVVHFASGVTNEEGRLVELLPSGDILEQGLYKLVFDTGKYFTEQGSPFFFPFVEIHVAITDASHYHIPLLISPFGYTTYRGT